MQTLRTIGITLALLCGVAFLIAAWYVVIAVAVIFVLYTAVAAYTKLSKGVAA